MSRRKLDPTQRLHIHIRKRLAGYPAAVIKAAIAEADLIHVDGAGPMQAALDTAIAYAKNADLQQELAA